MVRQEEKQPLTMVREMSFALYALIQNLPAEDLNKLTLQRVNAKTRRALMWKLHLLNCACDRAETGRQITDEDVVKHRALPFDSAKWAKPPAPKLSKGKV